VLINGQGHQYHDGREGTNASWANASVTDFRTGPGWMKVTSDATDAYQLVNLDVTLVERTLFYLKPDVLLILDRVKATKAATVQVRYQVYNDDGGGAVAAADGRFTITRPKAVLSGSVQTAGPASVHTGKIELAECTSTYQPAKASVHEFAEIESAAATAHVILTVAAASPSGTAPGALKITAIDGGWQVNGTHGGRKVDVKVILSEGAVPVVTVQ
jgi:hypothetical protein